MFHQSSTKSVYNGKRIPRSLCKNDLLTPCYGGKPPTPHTVFFCESLLNYLTYLQLYLLLMTQ